MCVPARQPGDPGGPHDASFGTEPTRVHRTALSVGTDSFFAPELGTATAITFQQGTGQVDSRQDGVRRLPGSSGTSSTARAKDTEIAIGSSPIRAMSRASCMDGPRVA